MKTHHKSSKRVKLSTKYNLQKRVREHKRRLKKEAKKMGMGKRTRRDPGIPNSWPFKAEMLAELEVQKEKRDIDMAKRHAAQKERAKLDHKQLAKDRHEANHAREAARREKRSSDVEKANLKTFRTVLPQSEIILEVLDSRDPLGCRCAALEAWAEEKKKRIIFVLAKADLVTPETAAKWLHYLGQTAPTVVVQAEAGREGVAELLQLLGQAPGKEAAVGVFGYAGTGKKALCKAIRQEVKTTAPWLLEACKLRPASGQAPGASSALHTVMCGSVARGAATGTSVVATVASGSGIGATAGVDPVEVVKELLTRVPQQAVLRHFRLPMYDGAAGFLKVFCEDRKLKTKKGKVAGPEAIAQRVLVELPALPGCFCSPPEASAAGAQNFWSNHANGKQQMQQAMEQQVKTLAARGVSGPAATALTIASGTGFGMEVNIVGLLTVSKDESYIEGEDDVSDSNADSDDESMSGSMGEEDGEEESDFEGDESEDMSDDV